MNYQTQRKINQIKEAIKNQIDLREIDKFFHTLKKKQEFLDKNNSHFSEEQLKYLKYIDTRPSATIKLKNRVADPVADPEAIDLTDLTKDNLEKTDNTLENTNTNTEVAELTTFFKDSLNLKTLMEIVIKYRKNTENLIELLDDGELKVPEEFLQIKLNGGMSVKCNTEIYEKIIELAYKNRMNKGQFITYVMWDFLKRHS